MEAPVRARAIATRQTSAKECLSLRRAHHWIRTRTNAIRTLRKILPYRSDHHHPAHRRTHSRATRLSLFAPRSTRVSTPLADQTSSPPLVVDAIPPPPVSSLQISPRAAPHASSHPSSREHPSPLVAAPRPPRAPPLRQHRLRHRRHRPSCRIRAPRRHETSRTRLFRAPPAAATAVVAARAHECAR